MQTCSWDEIGIQLGFMDGNEADVTRVRKCQVVLASLPGQLSRAGLRGSWGAQKEDSSCVCARF